MKKTAPILVALALVAVGGISFYLGRQSAPVEPEQTQPAASTVEEAQPQELANQVKEEKPEEEKVDTVEYTEAQLFELYEDLYQRVESRKNELKLFHLEDRINFEIQVTGKRVYGSVEKIPADHADRYLEWRNEYHPDNKDSQTTNDTQDATPSEVTTSGTAQSTFKEVNEIVYTTSSVNVRAEATTDSAKLGSLAKGSKVTRIGIGDGWSKVEFNGQVAYINSDYLSTSKPVAQNTKPSTQAPVQNQKPANVSGGSGSSVDNNSGSQVKIPGVTVIEDMGFTSPEMENGHVGGIDTSNLEIIG